MLIKKWSKIYEIEQIIIKKRCKFWDVSMEIKDISVKDIVPKINAAIVAAIAVIATMNKMTVLT